MKATFIFWAGHKDKRSVRLQFENASKTTQHEELKQAARQAVLESDPSVNFVRPNKERLILA